MCSSQGYQQTKETLSIICHRQARDAFVYWCFLLFSPPLIALLPCLHPSIVSSSLTLTAKLLPLLIMLHCDFSQGLSSLLFPLFICSVFETGVSGSRPLITTGMQLMCMSGCSGLQRPHGPAQYSWELEMTCFVYLEWVLLHIFSLAPFTQSIWGPKTRSTCINFQNVDRIILVCCSHSYVFTTSNFLLFSDQSSRSSPSKESRNLGWRSKGPNSHFTSPLCTTPVRLPA